MLKLFVFISLLVSSVFADEIQWEESLKTAMIKAQKEHKIILFISSRHSCYYCQRLEKNTLSDKRVIQAIKQSFISVIAYSDDNDFIPKVLQKPVTPAIWFLNAKGEPLFQAIIGYISSKDFFNALKAVK